MEHLEGGDGVEGSHFKDKVAEGDVLSSDVRAVTAILLFLQPPPLGLGHASET